MLKFIDRNKEEISRNIDLSNTREILTYLSSKKILDKFSKGALLAIVLYSNVSTINKRYEDLKARKALFTPLFEMPSIWVNNLPKKIRVRHKSSSKKKMKVITIIDYEFMLVKYLMRKCYLMNNI